MDHSVDERRERLEDAAGEAGPGEHSAPPRADGHGGVGGAPGGHGAGHDKHAGHSVAMFRDRFWLTLALTVPVVLLSHDVQRWLGYTIPMFPGSEYLPAILGTIVFLYGGLVFMRGALRGLRLRSDGLGEGEPVTQPA